MFWKKKEEPKKAARARATATRSDGGHDEFDLSQFGIKPVSDKDVEAEMAKMMAEMSSGAGMSEDLDGSDEETQLMRQIHQIGVDIPSSALSTMLSGSLDDGDDDGELSDSCLDDPHLQAELQGILGTAKKSAPSREEERVRLQQLVETEKQNAITLKRAGQIQAALDAMRAMKAYEAQIEALGPPALVQAVPLRRPVAIAATATNAPPTVLDRDDDDHHDIDVTDDDLNNPEFDVMLRGDSAKPASTKAAQIAAAVDVVTVESIQTKILSLKHSAMELKQQNKIPQALAALKEARALEPTLAELLQRQERVDAHPTEAAGDVSFPQGQSDDERTSADRGHVEPDDAANDSDVDGEDMDVTDDDLDNPEFDAILSGGSAPNRPSDSAPLTGTTAAVVAVVATEANLDLDTAQTQARIAELKLQAMQLKQGNRIPEALATLKEARALEAQLASAALETTPVQPVTSPLENSTPPSDEPCGCDNVTPPSQPTQDGAARDDIAGSPALAIDQDGVESHRDSRPRTSSSHLIDEFEDDDEEFHDAVALPPTISLQDQLNAAKAAAIALKKQGNIPAALIQLRLVKELEAKILSGVQSTSSGPTPEEIHEQRQRALAYEAIEKQLVDHGNNCRAEASRLLPIDRSRAQGQLDLHKVYVAALETLRAARANPLQPPPITHVEERVDMEEHVNVEVPLDRVEVSVLQMRSTAAATASKDLFVKLGLNVPSQNPHELTTSSVRGTGAGLYTYNAVGVFPIQRNRGLQKLVELRKAQVEVFTAAGFFSASQSVGKATVPLSPLLSASEISCWVPLMVSRRPCGLDVQIRIRLHMPLRDKDFRPVKTSVFVVDAYPPPVVPIQQRSVAAPAIATIVPATPPPPPAVAISVASPPLAAPAGAKRTAEAMDEDDDPHSVDKIVSYDVICEEVAKLEEKIKGGAATSAFADRLDSLALKKQLLEIDIQTGKLTEAMYIDVLKARIATDTALARSLLQHGRKLDGARVFHRVKVMQQEIASATTPPAES